MSPSTHWSSVAIVVKPVQTLEIYQSLWAMELRHPRLPEASDEDKFEKVAAAGFDGICLDPAVDEIPKCRSLAGLFQKYGLGCMINAFPNNPDDMQPLLELAHELDACIVNVISGVTPIMPEDAMPVVRRWMAEADSLGLPLLFETHRDSLLNDMYFTLQLMQLVPEMRLCADMSHFVVDRELRAPLPDRDAAYIHSILERSDCFQGRVASREQIQVQIGFAQHQQWVDIFKGWWRDGIRMWRQRNADDATLRFLCELGPPPYAITDLNQDELSDRWEEALQIRAWIRQIWAELDDELAS